MAAAAGTVIDGIKKMYTDIAGLQLLPDAGQHAAFLQGAQQAIQAYLGQVAAKAAAQSTQIAQQAAGGQSPGGPPLGGGGPAGPPNADGPPPPPPPPQQMGPGGGPGQPAPNTMKNPDELRRILAGASGTGQ